MHFACNLTQKLYQIPFSNSQPAVYQFSSIDGKIEISIYLTFDSNRCEHAWTSHEIATMNGISFFNKHTHL